ncbi:aminotransferase class V-fold PLP-dependent enzyme [Streptomyces sp. NBC_00059]|uniref:aminotransferase class V-fold PLP-dependent enzyme n=1 Tax=Streptomyces sp. NBC_00059 TaxID=2975635 RepID=UPI00225A1BB9|nr:aminotransferase class V-fold PLP-dependent enzyme [Streptomyces sp. NBC_00059]MCX5415775.1 aminotransferase class V-fold PLP-dependent enzyme [Streptomyces sp. NBC_00059]
MGGDATRVDGTGLRSQEPWIRRFGTPGERVRSRLYCFPFGGGGASAYRKWGEALGPDSGIDLCAVQLPGREERLGEPLLRTVDEVVDAFVPVLEEKPYVPFAFFGHSMGALLAFEVCRRLRTLHRELPGRLFVSGLLPPDRMGLARVRHTLDDEGFVESLRETDEQLDGVLGDPELTQLFLPILRADFKLCEIYRHQEQEPLACPITAFGGVADPMVGEEILNGWRRFTTGTFRTRMFPGGHFYLREHERRLVQLIGAGMQGLQASRSEGRVPSPAPGAVSAPAPVPAAPPFDVDRARRETPGANRVIHFNNAGASLMPVPVVDAMTRHLWSEAQVGSYEAAERDSDAANRVYDALGLLLNCDAQDIAFLNGGAHAWNQAFYAVPLKPGDRILASSMEYGGNHLALLQVARRTGAVVEIMPTDETGRVDVAALRRSIDDRVRLVVATHVPTHGGLVNPVAEICAAAREVSALSLVDACQSVGQVPIDVRQIGCDFLAASGRKYLRGPRGTGFLYAREDCVQRVEPITATLDGARWLGGSRYEYAEGARRFESWEVNTAAKIGLGVAVDYALEWTVERGWQRTVALAAELRSALGAVPGVRVVDEGPHLSGLVSFVVEGRDHTEAREALLARGANVWNCLAHTACVDMTARQLPSVVRASVHYFNTTDEVGRFCTLLEEVIRDLAPSAA